MLTDEEVFMPVVVAPKNVLLKVMKILIKDEKTKRHLENLGILVNSEFTILSESNGDIILRIKDTRLAINRDTALKILVAVC
ncbi:MAG: ferrous iron transport protein A [Bacilli bacterium]|nr:ferrous iron transport protein A [Bacilli bacterium]